MFLSGTRFKELTDPQMDHFVGTLPMFLLDFYTIT